MTEATKVVSGTSGRSVERREPWRRARRLERSALGRAAAGAFGLAAAIVVGIASCSSTPTRPAEEGNCVPTPDLPCKDLSTGGGQGGSTPIADTGVPESSVFADAAACGNAVGLVTTSNTTCQPCLENGCCLAATACSNDPNGCTLLLGCEVNCAPNDTGCASICQTQYPSAVAAFGDLNSCMQGMCPGCPTLVQVALIDP